MSRGFRGTADWFGKESPLRPEMSLELSATQLCYRFRVQKAATCDLRHEPGDFVEGLWQKDVAELFVAGLGTDYQEVNISPTGAWWSAYFSDYRKLVREVFFEPRITVEASEGHWAVNFEAPLEAFVPLEGLSLEDYRFSATAILYTPEAQYFAWNHSGGGEPDFHRSELFQALRS